MWNYTIEKRRASAVEQVWTTAHQDPTRSKRIHGLRTLAKMMLNSMWGKFGQRLNKTRVQEFDDPQAFHRFLDTDTLDVRHVSIMNDQMVEVLYQYQKEDIPVSPNLNIFVACFHIMVSLQS